MKLIKSFSTLLLFSFMIGLIGLPAFAENKIIDLPDPQVKGKISVEETIQKRRSIRAYKRKSLSMKQISQLLWSAQGITDPNWDFRAAPSAGALYPLEIYLVKKDGVFHYLPDGHKLEQISTEDKRKSLVRGSLGQKAIEDAPISIVIAADFDITREKYGFRADRYVHMEAGHVGENIHLQAVGLGLSTVALGAFWDDVIKKTLELPEEVEPLYIFPVGYSNE